MPTDRIALVTGANQGVGKRSPKNWSRTMSPCSSDRAIWLVARQPRPGIASERSSAASTSS